MIKLKAENLTSESEIKVRKLLNSSEFAILLTVIESQQTMHQQAAIEKAMDSKVFEKYNSLANGELEKAIRMKDCLDVLKELKARQDPLQIVKPESTGTI